MQNKSQRINLIPSTAVGTGGNVQSQVEKNTWGRGVRIYVTVSAVTATGTNDSLYLCGQVPGGSTVIQLTGFAGANLLSVVGTFAFDFYPGAWLPPGGIAAAGNLLGTAGVHLPIAWAVKLIWGTGNAATVVVHAETLP